MTKVMLENLIYKIILDELEPRKKGGALEGDPGHIAQKLTESISKKIAEPKKKEKKEKGEHYIACYKSTDRWMLITREISTLGHAEKKSDPYKKAGYVVKIIPLDL